MKRLPLLTLLMLLFTPMVYAYNFAGTYNYVGAGGGIIHFSNVITANGLYWANGLIRFSNLIWGARNYGTLGFDADAGVNVTITEITQKSLTYTVNPNVTSTVATRIYYQGKARPSSYDGASRITHDEDTGITTVYTLGGDKTVELEWAYGSEYINMRNIIYMAITLFNLCAFATIAIMFSNVRGSDIKAIMTIIIGTIIYNLIMIALINYLS